MVLEHSYECSYCRELKPNKEDIKMCGGCKVMGYCSKECQKADWKEHKLDCKGVLTGQMAITRNPVIKVAERIAADQEIMTQIDPILIAALDLIHHPENAEKSAVCISARVEYTDVHAAKDRMLALMAGREPPPLPPKVPKLFQIAKAVTIEDYPEGLDRVVEIQKQKFIEQGYLLGKKHKQEILVKAFFVDTEVSLSTMYFCRLITNEMLDVVGKWRHRDLDGIETNEPSNLKDLIDMFNITTYTSPPAIKAKLTTMVSTKNME